nr:hypothetical protein Iba_chr07bCG5450 [Ipomoea batatas]
MNVVAWKDPDGGKDTELTWETREHAANGKEDAPNGDDFPVGLVGEVSSSSWIPISAFLSSSCCTSFNASSKSSIASLRANSASANSSSFFSNAIFISLAFFCSSTHFSSLVNIGLQAFSTDTIKRFKKCSGSLLIRINSGSSSDETNTGIRTCAE